MNMESKDTPKILLVEDSEMVVQITLGFLKSKGYVCEAVTSGEAALDVWDRHFSLILLDLGLPGLSGLEVCHHIRNVEKATGGHIPIIVITAFGEAVKQAAEKAGADAFMTKPVEFDVLERFIQKYLN